MSELIIIPNDKKNIKKIDDCVLLGISGYSVNVLEISINELKDILQNKKNIFITLNKNFVNSELKDLENLLIELNDLGILGVFYYDVGIVNIVKRLKLSIDLIWSAEHLTTNYYTINYWYNHGVKSTFISNEITIDEIIDISLNTKSNLIVQLFGYIPMYVSRRHAIKNYLKHFEINNNSNKYHLFKEDKLYSIVDNNEGTIIYSNFILNGLKEYIKLKDKVEYVLINGYDIDSEKLIEVVNLFKKVNHENMDIFDEKLNQLFDNLGSGFLYEESIYRVKKDAK